MGDLSASGELVGGRFRLGAVVGVGGTAAVFEAEDLVAGDLCAVKVMHAHLVSGSRAGEAFAAEATLARRLDHPNVARVRDHGWQDSGGIVQPWIALDLVEGRSLAARVAERGPVPPAAAARAVGDVLGALGAAHELGLVHRDVSPDNVLIDADGTVRLIDFGLAAVSGLTATGSDPFGSSDAGAAVGAIGHAHFMSPEQAQGLPVGAGGDLYQAGALLYFLLTGEPPFPRSSPADVARAHVSAPVPVPSARARAARSFDAVVVRALDKDPARRFASATAMAQAVRGAVAATTVAPLVASGADRTSVVVTDGPGFAIDGPAAPRVSVVAAVVLVAVAVLVATVWGLSGRESSVALASPAPSPTPAVEVAPVVAAPVPTPTATAAPEPQQVTVPPLDGTLSDVERRLLAAGLQLGTVRSTESAAVKDTVVGSSVAAGAQVAPGSSVDLVTASGSNRVPEVAGLQVGEARAIVEAAGFRVTLASRTAAGADVARAVGTQPGSGALLATGVTVTIEVVEPARTPEEPGA